MVMKEIKKTCYDKVCEKCIYRGEISKGIFGTKISCNKNRKPNKNTCFYFACEGKNASRCETCGFNAKNKEGNE